MNVAEAIACLDANALNKTTGLPDDIFYFISRTTPLVNVDLLIKDKQGRTLLSWRDDEYCGKGWHIPGGIIRYKETLEQRIQNTANKELGVCVEFGKEPLVYCQTILPDQENRGHFISFLFKCFVPDNYHINSRSLTMS
jgi:colanic acid biosynthesis protein WcaH